VCFPGVVEDPLPKLWVETFKTLNYHYSENPFSGDAVGGFNNPVTVDPSTKTRSYAATAYYAPAKGRSNLHVMTEAFVEKIILDESDLTAWGVQYVHDGKTKEVRAKREVILAAGALQSPKLLELSGIGSADLLRSHNIPVYVDNPFVGENLQDHLMTGISFEVVDGIETMDGLIRDEPEVVQAAREAYINHQTGPLVSSGAVGFSFMPNDLSLGGQEMRRDLLNEYLQDEKGAACPSQKIQYSALRSVLENPLDSSAIFFMYPAQNTLGTHELLPGNFVTICISLLHPFSRGHVHIQSGDATQAPTIDPKYLSHPLDMAIFARHLLYIDVLAKTQPLASILKPNGQRNSPNAFIKDLREAEEYIRAKVESNWHPTGTCAMMPREIGGVVNERLLVYGVKRLRIIDASIFPLITRGNCQSSVYAVAERAADLIKEDHGLPT
jgi:choline dehydrogenase-like flavoprotein